MNTQDISFQLPPNGTATLTLPQALSPDAFTRLDRAVAQALREPNVDANADASTKASRDAGAIEFDSWLVHLQ